MIDFPTPPGTVRRAMKFNSVTAYGSAGGAAAMGEVVCTIKATACDTVESVRALVAAAPDLLESVDRLLRVIPYSKIGAMQMEVIEQVKAIAKTARGG